MGHVGSTGTDDLRRVTAPAAPAEVGGVPDGTDGIARARSERCGWGAQRAGVRS
jgi:hypothetical protein